jgi:hypothetical protein
MQHRTKSLIFVLAGLCVATSGCRTEPRVVYVDLNKAASAFQVDAATPFESPGLDALEGRPLAAGVVPKSRPLTSGGVSDKLSQELSRELQEQLEQSRALSEKRLQSFLEKNYLAEARAGEASQLAELAEPIAKHWREADARTQRAFLRYAEPLGKLRNQLANLVGSPDPRTNRARLRQPWVPVKPTEVQDVRDQIETLESEFDRERLVIVGETAAKIDRLIVDVLIATALRVDDALVRAKKESRDRLAAVSSFDILLLNSESVAQSVLGSDAGPFPVSPGRMSVLSRLDAGQVKPSAIHLGKQTDAHVRSYVESWAALRGLKLSTDSKGKPDMTSEFLQWRQSFRTGR